MTSSDKSSHSRIALAIAVMGAAAFFAAMMLAEWFPIIVARSPARIASYHFGTASAMGHGGWRYANPEVYAWTAFVEAIAAAATVPALWMIMVRRSRRAVIVLVVICAAYIGASLALGQRTWTRRATLNSAAASAKATPGDRTFAKMRRLSTDPAQKGPP